MKKRLIHIPAIAAAVLSCNSCMTSILLMCGINPFAETPWREIVITNDYNGELIPQAGAALVFPYEYVIVETKWTEGSSYWQDFKYRACINGIRYSYAENPDTPKQRLYIPVPENDTHAERTIRIDISTRYSLRTSHGIGEQVEDWSEWETLLECEQAGLADGQERVLQDIDNWGINITIGDDTFPIAPADNASVTALKAKLLRDDIHLDFYNWKEEINSGPSNEIISFIPLNHLCEEKIEVRAGDIYMDDCGDITIRLTGFRWLGRYSTYLGTVPESGLKILNEFCTGDIKSFPATLSLSK